MLLDDSVPGSYVIWRQYHSHLTNIKAKHCSIKVIARPPNLVTSISCLAFSPDAEADVYSGEGTGRG